MTETLVEIRVQVVTDIAITGDQVERRLVDDELFLEPAALCCLIIGIGDIRDGDALRAILRSDPVCIRQVDANSRRGIFVTAQHCGTDHIG